MLEWHFHAAKVPLSDCQSATFAKVTFQTGKNKKGYAPYGTYPLAIHNPINAHCTVGCPPPAQVAFPQAPSREQNAEADDYQHYATHNLGRTAKPAADAAAAEDARQGHNGRDKERDGKAGIERGHRD